jgi:hypothetical protein
MRRSRAVKDYEVAALLRQKPVDQFVGDPAMLRFGCARAACTSPSGGTPGLSACLLGESTIALLIMTGRAARPAHWAGRQSPGPLIDALVDIVAQGFDAGI